MECGETSLNVWKTRFGKSIAAGPHIQNQAGGLSPTPAKPLDPTHTHDSIELSHQITLTSKTCY